MVAGQGRIIYPSIHFVCKALCGGRAKGFIKTWFQQVLLLIVPLALLTGCQTPVGHREEADRVATRIIQATQEEALGRSAPFTIERPGDILRRRLLIGQRLPYTNEASLGTDKLKKIEHWPEKGYPGKNLSPDKILSLAERAPLKIDLVEALQIGARNSPQYQLKKETIFRAALDLDLERNEFRSILGGKAEGFLETDLSGRKTVTGTEVSGDLDARRKLKTGMQLGAALALDLVKLLTQDHSSTLGIVGDASITIPLLRGSGRHIVTEPLTQAQRNVLYAIWEFERFKKTFAVDVAKRYLEVLRRLSEVENAAENYRNLISSTRRTRRMADAGRVSEIEVDQSLQNELRARNRWIRAEEAYKGALDSFKLLVGLPPDADILLDKATLDNLIQETSAIMAAIEREEAAKAGEPIPPANAPIRLDRPGQEGAGPLEMDPSRAIELGLKKRLDLRVAEGKVYDAQRDVVVRADALRAEITLLGKARLGESRSIETATRDNAKLRTDKGIYSALLTIDLPFERTAERNAYRKSYIDLEKSVRDLQELEDEIKLAVRDRLRAMYEARETRRIQARARLVAEKRVKSTALFFEAGRIPIRDVLEAQEALINAKNGFISAVIDYRIAELEFQRDTGLLRVDERGLWREYTP
ncbi:MAG: TolC family protein [Deltaproteobacteria bacterium]|nr:TolC family protein [Deltaproteobacteria bacterium]MBW2138850.1 TolC family protein [Deltaproteobacteria bacterium]